LLQFKPQTGLLSKIAARPAGACAATDREDIMVRDTYRIVVSVVGVFIALGALAWALHGLIFDDAFAFRWGVVIIFAAITAVVALLNSQSNGDS
jgi:hypothetical protein